MAYITREQADEARMLLAQAKILTRDGHPDQAQKVISTVNLLLDGYDRASPPLSTPAASMYSAEVPEPEPGSAFARLWPIALVLSCLLLIMAPDWLRTAGFAVVGLAALLILIWNVRAGIRGKRAERAERTEAQREESRAAQRLLEWETREQARALDPDWAARLDLLSPVEDPRPKRPVPSADVRPDWKVRADDVWRHHEARAAKVEAKPHEHAWCDVTGDNGVLYSLCPGCGVRHYSKPPSAPEFERGLS